MPADWLNDISAALNLDREVIDVNAQLRLARDVSRGVERKAAPLTAFAIGYAAGAQGADRAQVGELIELIHGMCPPATDSDD